MSRGAVIGIFRSVSVVVMIRLVRRFGAVVSWNSELRSVSTKSSERDVTRSQSVRAVCRCWILCWEYLSGMVVVYMCVCAQDIIYTWEMAVILQTGVRAFACFRAWRSFDCAAVHDSHHGMVSIYRRRCRQLAAHRSLNGSVSVSSSTRVVVLQWPRPGPCLGDCSVYTAHCSEVKIARYSSKSNIWNKFVLLPYVACSVLSGSFKVQFVEGWWREKWQWRRRKYLGKWI